MRTDTGRIATEIVVDAAGAAAGHVARLAGVAVPIVPIKHQYVVSEPLPGGGAPADVPTVRDPDHIVYFRGVDDRPRRAACSSAATSATPQVCWPTGDEPPLAAPRALFAPDLERFAESWAAARRRVPAPARHRDRPGGQRRRGVHAGRRVPARRDRGARLLGRGGLLRARARRGRRGRQGDGRVDRRRPARVRRGARWTSGASARTRPAARGRRRRRWTPTRATTTSSTRTQEWTAGRPLRRSAAWPRLVELDAAFGEKAGWERVNWFGAHAGAGDAALRPRGWAGRVLVAGDRGRVRRRPPRPPGSSTSRRSPSSTCAAPGAAAFLRWMCAERRRPSGGHGRLHPTAQRARPGSRPT